MTTQEMNELKRIGEVLGYRFERTETEREIIERMIRSDGSVAVTATKLKSQPCPCRCTCHVSGDA